VIYIWCRVNEPLEKQDTDHVETGIRLCYGYHQALPQQGGTPIMLKHRRIATTESQTEYRVSQNKSFFTEIQVFGLFDKSSQEGLDGLPDWFPRFAAPLNTTALTHLINLSVVVLHFQPTERRLLSKQ